MHPRSGQNKNRMSTSKHWSCSEASSLFQDRIIGQDIILMSTTLLLWHTSTEGTVSRYICQLARNLPLDRDTYNKLHSQVHFGQPEHSGRSAKLPQSKHSNRMATSTLSIQQDMQGLWETNSRPLWDGEKLEANLHVSSSIFYGWEGVCFSAPMRPPRDVHIPSVHFDEKSVKQDHSIQKPVHKSCGFSLGTKKVVSRLAILADSPAPLVSSVLEPAVSASHTVDQSGIRYLKTSHLQVIQQYLSKAGFSFKVACGAASHFKKH